MNIMLRWARRIAIFLLLGAIVNVAFAWGCALPRRRHWSNGAPLPSDEQTRWWRANCPEGVVDTPDEVHVTHDMGYEAVAMSAQSQAVAAGSDVIRVSAGWPLISMTGEHWSVMQCTGDHVFPIGQVAVVPRGLWVFRRPTGHGYDQIYHIPLEPIWGGFLLNAIGYGLAIWLCVAIPAFFTRWHRTRWHRCIACGYPRGTSPVCTECGEPLPSPSDRARSR